MSKRVGIVTIVDNDNYGNRLQNYALYRYVSKMNFDVDTLINQPYSNTKNLFLVRLLKNSMKKDFFDIPVERKKRFYDFNKHISFSKKKITAFSKLNEYDYIIVGSDQVWNPFINRLRDVDLLSSVDNKKRISYSASFGVSDLPNNYLKKIKKELLKFKMISVREDSGKDILSSKLGIDNVEVLVDPTMLLTDVEWSQLLIRPKQIDDIPKKKFILNYFLGQLSNERKKEIEKIADENDCSIINLLDKNDPFYMCGPSEFLFLEKNAFLICTDSFHSSVFAILFNRPFVVFNREQNNFSNMNTRIETLISKFEIKNREYNGKKITKENLKHDYTEAYKTLEKERKKSKKFLEKALDIKESDD